MKNNKLYSVLIALIVALGGFLLGFDSAVISGATPFYKNSFSLDTGSWLIGFSVGSIILGAILGNIMAGKLADRYGRKQILIYTAVLFAFCALGTALANDIVFFIIARIVGGVGVGMAILIAPMYIAEIAPSEMRGKLVTFNQLNIVLGISVAYFSNYFFQQGMDDPDMKWRWMLGVGVIPAVLYFFTLFIVPRSPRWLMQKGHDEEALKVLVRVNGKERADSVFEEIKANLKKDSASDRSSFKEVFSKKMKTVLIIGFGIAFFQQITGINAIFYYAPMIFEMAGGGKDAAFMQAIIIGLTNVAMTIVAMFLIDKLGRKPLLIIGSIGITASLSLVGFSFMNAEYTLSEKSISVIRSEISLPAEQQEAFFNSLSELEGITYAKEVMFFSEVKEKIGNDNYNAYKEVILKNSISIKSIWVLIGLIMYVASFAISLGPVMWALLSEIFPNKLRGLAISIVGFWNSIVSFSVASLFPMELEFLGSSLTFYVFAAFGFLTLLFVVKFIPETKGKSLEEIEASLVGN
ncbi:sugar porter family MFS transporter [bacterium]|nr:sugar porter family MFS transporter [bacterium]